MNNKITAEFNSKKLWVTLWVLAFADLLLSIRALSMIKPETCVALCVLAILLSVAGTLVGYSASRTRLEVDGEYVYCKKLFGREMYLHLRSVTGISFGLFNTVCISAPSFKVRCAFVTNKQDILEAVKGNASK